MPIEKKEKPRIDYWKKYAATMDRDGWPICRLAYKEKKPLGMGWQKGRMRPEAIKKYADSKVPYGIGIRCGNAIGIDNDYELGPGVTQEFLNAINDLTDRHFPEAFRRTGRPTRPKLRLVRLKKGETYKSLNVHKLQILARGKQFVARNIHPDTNKPYKWDDGQNPEENSFRDVPVITIEDLTKFIEEAQILIDAFGLGNDHGVDTLDRLMSGEKVDRAKLKAPSQEALEKAVKYIKCEEGWEWDDWNNNIMMPLYNASEGEDWGLDLAHEISERDNESKYDFDDTEKRWSQLVRSPASLLGWPRLRWLARQGGMPDTGSNEWDDFHFVLDQEKFFIAKKKGQWMSDKTFNNVYIDYRTDAVKQKVKALTPMQNFLKGRPEQCVDQVTWNPVLPSGTSKVGNKMMFNTWQNPDWFGEPGNVSVWLNLMGRVYGDEAELVIKRMAYDVQYPHLRPQWHPLVKGSQGIGKSSSLYPIMEWAKRFNFYSMVSVPSIKGQFNSFLNSKKILIVNELYGVDNARFNVMKDWLAGTEDQIEINEKFVKPYYVANVASFYFSTNAADPVSITRKERRFLVVQSHAKSPATKKEKAAARKEFRWIKKNWMHVIHYLKHDITVHPGFGQTNPKTTQAQKDLADMTAPMYEVVADLIPDIVKNKILFTIEYIDSMLVGAGSSVDVDAMTNKTIAKALYKLGALKCGRGKQIRLDGEKHYIWTFEKDLAGADNDLLRSVWNFAGVGDNSS